MLTTLIFLFFSNAYFFLKILILFLKFGYPVSVENAKKIFLKPPDSPLEYGIWIIIFKVYINI